MTSRSPVLPDYEGASLATVVPALMSSPGQRPGWVPEVARSAEQIVLFVVDGLGWLQLQQRRTIAPTLAAMEGGSITSVCPSTTATALTSLVVGAAPARHGVVGYRVAVEAPSGREVMNVLKWRTGSGDARPFVDPLRFQVLDPFGGVAVPVVSRADFAGTAFTDAHQRGARQVGWAAASGLAVDVGRLLGEGEPFVYAYYDGVDRIAHVNGFDAHYDAELTALDRIVADLVETLPVGAALVVTADHGQVEVGRAAQPLDPSLVADCSLISGEARFRWLHAAGAGTEAVADLAGRAEMIYGHEAWVLTYDQVVEQGWFGGPLPPEFRSRVGDVAIVPFEPTAYLEGPDASDAKLMCRHGSLTEDEMLVPLISTRR